MTRSLTPLRDQGSIHGGYGYGDPICQDSIFESLSYSLVFPFPTPFLGGVGGVNGRRPEGMSEAASPAFALSLVVPKQSPLLYMCFAESR